MKQISCAVLDIETTHLNADFGIVLCGVVKPAVGKAVVIRGDKANPAWKNRRSDDSETVKALVAEMAKYDIWIAHNGAYFDIPFLRTRLAKWRLPPLPTRILMDPVRLARNKLKMSYNSLEKIAEFLGVNTKTDVDCDQWLAAALDGSKKAMDYVVRHCLEDCVTLERVVEAIKSYSTQLNSWGSGF